MAAPLAKTGLDIALTGTEIGARGYVDLTLDAMRAFGAKVEQLDAATWRVEPTGYTAADFHIEPDASAATYLWGLKCLQAARSISARRPRPSPSPMPRRMMSSRPFPTCPR